MDNPFAQNETIAQIFVEETFLQGALLSNILYGVELTLFLICFTLLWRQINQSNKRRQLSLLAFVTVIFILGTLFMGSAAKFTQLAFIEDRNYPGGPGAYEPAIFSIPVGKTGNISLVIGNFLMDALLYLGMAMLRHLFGNTPSTIMGHHRRSSPSTSDINYSGFAGPRPDVNLVSLQ